MKRKIFRKLIDQENANKIFLDHIPSMKSYKETISVNQALQRILAVDIFSDHDIPPFDRASMDGFAVIASDTFGAEEDNPVYLNIVGELKAGYVFNDVVGPSNAVEISTGAPLPTGANAVVMVEYTDIVREEDNTKTVKIFRGVSPYENTMAAGTDIQLGERVLSAGTLLTSRELAVLAAIGLSEVEVHKKPLIGVYSSGDEIVNPGDELTPGKLFDINSTAICTSINENGGQAEFLGILSDQEEELREGLKEAISKFEMVIISGGTSAGMGDILYQIIDDLGDPGLLVHGIKVKPGKPTILGVCNGVPVVGLPGYPASALSIFQLFIQPLVRKMARLPSNDQYGTIDAVVKQRMRSVEGRYEFKPVYLMKGGDEMIAYPVPGGSGAITSVALADGFIHIPEQVSFIPASSKVQVNLLSPNIRLTSLQIVGSHDIGLAQLLKVYEKSYPGRKTRSISVGSMGGVSAIRRGEAHIAGIHLLDSTRGYNEWVIDELESDLVKGYKRMQGFVVQQGNPKEIYSLTDLLKEDVRFINRNEGSGTRILLDIALEKVNIDAKKITGYRNSVRSHSSIAQVVQQGKADVGIAIQAAQIEGLDFIPFREEEYDFLINRKYAELEEVKDFIQILKSNEFKNIISNLAGYTLD